MLGAFATGSFACFLVSFRGLFFGGAFFGKRSAATAPPVGMDMGKLFPRQFFQIIHDNLLYQNIFCVL
jgi:hypothetical protein